MGSLSCPLFLLFIILFSLALSLILLVVPFIRALFGPLSRTMCFPVWTARCPNVVFSPFGLSIGNRIGGLLGRLVVILGPLESLLGRPTATLTLSEAL